jgi:hypothetical protein
MRNLARLLLLAAIVLGGAGLFIPGASAAGSTTVHGCASGGPPPLCMDAACDVWDVCYWSPGEHCICQGGAPGCYTAQC